MQQECIIYYQMVLFGKLTKLLDTQLSLVTN